MHHVKRRRPGLRRHVPALPTSAALLAGRLRTETTSLGPAQREHWRVKGLPRVAVTVIAQTTLNRDGDGDGDHCAFLLASPSPRRSIWAGVVVASAPLLLFPLLLTPPSCARRAAGEGHPWPRDARLACVRILCFCVTMSITLRYKHRVKLSPLEE